MSEPQTSAKVVLHTNKGRIDVELWAKQIPLHTKLFLQACHEGSLLEQSFCELSRDRNCLMISKLACGKELKHEGNGRIRFNRAGVLGWDCHYDRWFISLTPLSNQIGDKIPLGKLVDNSIYSLRKIVDESETDSDHRLLYPAVIERTEVTIPFFDSLKVPSGVEKLTVSENTRTVKAAKVRLSYDDDEDEDTVPMKKIKIKLPPMLEKASTTHVPNGPRSDTNESETKDSALVQERSGSDESDTDDRGAQGRDKKSEAFKDREQETLRMLASFQQNVKGKSIIKRSSNAKSPP